jgi:hypothetical protein
MIQTISDNLPRLSIYEKLNHDPALQTALLNIYTDVVEFSVRIFQYLKHPTIVRLSKLLATSLKKDLGDIIRRIREHARDVENTAVASELLRAAKFRDGIPFEL